MDMTVISEDLKTRLESTASKLVTFQSVASRPDQLKAIVDYVEGLLEEVTDRIYRYERNEKYSLVASLDGSHEPKLMYVLHLDVVDAPEHMFTPKVEGDRLYGRGAIDMKGPSAVAIELFRDWARRYPNTSLALMVTTDEEVGSQDGVEYLVKQEGWRPQLAVIPDGGLNFTVVTRNKGVIHLKAIAKGKSAHGSTPWLGDNAIDKALRFYTEVRSILNMSQHDLVEPRWYNTVNLGKISGGEKVNMVADRCELELDIRFVKPYSLDQIRATLETLALKWGLKLEYLTTSEPVEVDLDSPLVQAFLEVYRQTLGKEPVLRGEHGATDARHFTAYDIPVIMIYPVGYDVHGPNEWVDLNSLVTLYNLFWNYTERILL